MSKSKTPAPDETGVIKCFFVVAPVVPPKLPPPPSTPAPLPPTASSKPTALPPDVATTGAVKRQVSFGAAAAPRPSATPILEHVFEAEITQQTPRLGEDILPRSTCVFCFPEGCKALRRREAPATPQCFSFVLTNVSGDIKFVTVLLVYDRCPPGTIDAADARQIGEEVLLPKAFCLLSSSPCFRFCRSWLESYHRVILLAPPGKEMSGQAMISAVVGLPMPTPGHPTTAHRILGGVDLPPIIANPPNGLPVIDGSLYKTIRALGIGNVVRLLHAMLNEDKILFVSGSATSLALACEAFTSLLYPLKWPFTFATLIPRPLSGYFSQPMPYIYGALRSTFATLKKPALIDDGVLIADLEEGTLEGWKEPKFKLPQKEVDMLVGHLRESIDRLEGADAIGSSSWDSPNSEKLAAFQDETRAAFLSFFASLFCHHREFLCFLRVLPKPFFFFSKGRFIIKRPAEDKDFLSQFTSRQAFVTFVQDRPWPVGDAFDVAVERRIWEMPIAEAAALVRVLDNPDDTSHVGTPPHIQFTAIPKLSFAPRPGDLAPVDSELSQNVVGGLARFSIEQAYVTQAKAKFREEAFRKKFCEDLASILEKPRDASTKPWQLPSQQAWALIGDILGVLVLEATAQKEAVSAAAAMSILQQTFFVDQTGHRLFLADRVAQLDCWKDLDLWAEFFSVKVHNQLAVRYAEKEIIKRIGSLSQAEIDTLVDAEWAETRTRFAQHVLIMESLNVSVSLIKKLMPIIIVDFNEHLYQHLLEVLPSTTREKMKLAEDQQAATALPEDLARANVIVAWLDDKISEPGLQQNIALAKAEALKKKKYRVEVLQFSSSTTLKSWLVKFGQLAAPKLRIVTNRYRKFDGEDYAAKKAISVVREDPSLAGVPILIFCGNRQLAEPLLEETTNVYLATHPSGLCDFCMNGKP